MIALGNYFSFHPLQYLRPRDIRQMYDKIFKLLLRASISMKFPNRISFEICYWKRDIVTI